MKNLPFDFDLHFLLEGFKFIERYYQEVGEYSDILALNFARKGEIWDEFVNEYEAYCPN